MSATIRDAVIEMMYANANGANMRPSNPPRLNSGRKTSTMINVANRIEFLISLDALKITRATGSGSWSARSV